MIWEVKNFRSLIYIMNQQISLPITGTFVAKTSTQESDEAYDIKYTVQKIPELKMLRRAATKEAYYSLQQFNG